MDKEEQTRRALNFAKSDENERSDLVLSVLPLIRAMCSRKLAKQDVETVVQDVFVEMLNSINTFKGNGSFLTWIGRVASNTIADHFRKADCQRRYDILYSELCRQEPTTDEGRSYKDPGFEVIEVLELLDHIKDPRVDLIYKHFFEDMTFKEIATELNTTEETIHCRHRRVLAKLQDNLKKGRE